MIASVPKKEGAWCSLFEAQGNYPDHPPEKQVVFFKINHPISVKWDRNGN
jgi:hypothetical protein